ncbi:hypothetical protein CDG81_15765 [Actinopolyspora erythraea]|uniref:Uncharacterized protein n=1 Tax=Actinopolyspora erythraea TaxID=414996 RepID=A0A099D4B3_9ACTN|nr:hypothetical protein CDG81_15765 [Actinopolyspora erythraea]KGI80879.1 hypothetical protein IL38_13995 [Actinopolyspora erythraea]
MACFDERRALPTPTTMPRTARDGTPGIGAHHVAPFRRSPERGGTRALPSEIGPPYVPPAGAAAEPGAPRSAAVLPAPRHFVVSAIGVPHRPHGATSSFEPAEDSR